MGFSKMLKKIVVKNWILSKIAVISFRVRMLKSKNLKMGTSSKAQFTLTVRTVSVYIAKANVLMDVLFILLHWGFETSLIRQKLIFLSLVDRTDFENLNLRMLTSSNIRAWSKCVFYEQQCLECKFCICSLSYVGEWLSCKYKTC